MSKEMSLIALGIWVVIVPYLGVPSSWRTVLLVLTGLAVAIIGFLLRGEALAEGSSRAPRRRAEDSFVESVPPRPEPPQEPEEPHSPRIGSLN